MDTLPIINRTYDAFKRITKLVEHLPKRQRHSLGTSAEQTLLVCLESLILAKNAPRPLKAGYLLQAGSHLEILTLKLRLLLELKHGSPTNIFQIQEALAEVGRMLGGWLRAVQAP